MKSLWLVAVVALCIFTGCATPGASYAKAHPELSPVHRQILTAGEIPNGDAVAGMTKEQVRMAMGESPTSFDKNDGEDVWIYLHLRPRHAASQNDFSYNPNSSFDAHRTLTESDEFRARSQPTGKTVIFFKGDRATRARSGNGQL